MTLLEKAATIAAAGLALATAASGASTATTPDQQLVSGLAGARTVSTAAIAQLKPTPTIDKVTRAKVGLAVALKQLKSASAALPKTIGGADAEAVTTGLDIARSQTALALADVKKSNYDPARVKLSVAVESETTALRAFGPPLAADFSAFAVYRDLTNIEGWEGYVGLTARAGAPIAKIVVGIAGRETAAVGEPGGARNPPSIAISNIAIYTLQKPTGEYSSGWCRLVNGIMICKLNRTMAANETFSVSFGPVVPAGTRFLVKFWSTDGKRSHAIMTTR